MFEWLFGDPSAPTARSMQNVIQKPEPPCPHDDWRIDGANSVRPRLCGTCALCGEEVALSTLLNNWKGRIERELGVK